MEEYKRVKYHVEYHVEYASCVWDPYQANAIDALEKVQRKAVRYICSAYSLEDSVSELMSNLELQSLATRHRNQRLSLMYKLDKNLIPFEKPCNLQLKPDQRRNDNGRSYVHYRGRADYFMESFFPRTVRQWNSLTSGEVTRASLPAFRATLNKRS